MISIFLAPPASKHRESAPSISDTTPLIAAVICCCRCRCKMDCVLGSLAFVQIWMFFAVWSRGAPSSIAGFARRPAGLP